LGAILFQLPPSFTVNDFKNIEQFLDKLPTADGYDYAVEFRHPSWGTEGPWEVLRRYIIAAVMTDSPSSENLQFLSDVIITANQSFIRFHGRNTKGHYWYNYLYSEQELTPWVEKVNQIREQTRCCYSKAPSQSTELTRLGLILYKYGFKLGCVESPVHHELYLSSIKVYGPLGP
jgi:uncharacterized protein YecE (DUF72 family)